MDLTVLLIRMNNGDLQAADQAAAEVHRELLRIAQGVLGRENNLQTLNPTVLVNEVFMRLLGGRKVEWQDRKHFYLLTARMMRRIVIDYARRKKKLSRPHGIQVPLEHVALVSENRFDEALIVGEALEKLEAFDARAAKVVELRYFAGRSIDDIAEILDVGTRTVQRDWDAAQAWLKCFLGGDETEVGV